MIEGSGAGSVPRTNGSGSGRPKTYGSGSATLLHVVSYVYNVFIKSYLLGKEKRLKIYNAILYINEKTIGIEKRLEIFLWNILPERP
jgi:hypothetical protein